MSLYLLFCRKDPALAVKRLESGHGLNGPHEYKHEKANEVRLRAVV